MLSALLNRGRWVKSSLMLAAGYCNFAAAAQQEPAGIVFGRTTLLPALRTELRFDDNIFESAQAQRDSTVALLVPSLGALLEAGDSTYEIGYSAESASYFDSEDDDYVDHVVHGLADIQLSMRNNVTVRANFAATHEDRGTGLSEGLNPTTALNFNDPDQYEETQASARYRFGARGAKGRLEFEAGLYAKAYQNNRERTRFRDREDTYFSAAFYYRIRPRTSLLLQATATTIDYANDQPQEATLDSKQRRYLVGVEWDGSAQLTGSVKFGFEEKEFDNAVRENFSAPSWVADVQWSPRSYTQFDFSTERSTHETNGSGDFIDVRRIAADWTHAWNNRIQTVLGAAFVDEQYESLNRNEDIAEFIASFTYQLRRWLSIEFGATHRNRNSNVDLLNFERNIFSVGITAAL